MAGVGGDVEWSLFDGALIFTHEDSSTTSIAQPIALLATSGIPSLLGRDILAKGVLTLDGPGRQVSLDLPRGFLR